MELAKTNSNIKAYLAVLVGFATLYIATCAPGVLWQDSGLFQYRIWHNDIEGRLGLALAHPLYHLIGIAAKHIPWGHWVWRINLISAVCAAFAVANIFLLLRLWLNKTFPALVGAITFGLAHTIWFHACIAEVYSLYTAFFTAELIVLWQYCRTRRVGFLYWLALLNGLALANHMWAVIPMVCYVVFIIFRMAKNKIGIKPFLLMILLWIIGAAPYEYLIVKNILETGQIGATLSSAAFGNSWEGSVVNAHITGKIVKENIMFFGLNFPTPNILLFFVGFFALYKTTVSHSFAYIMLCLLILFFVFAFRYIVPDRYVFFIPFYCLASIFVGLGASVVMEKSKSRVIAVVILLFTLLPIGAYAAAPTIVKKMNVSLGYKRTIPFRNEYKYFLQPWQHNNHGPDQFAEHVFSVTGENAIICADSTSVYPLWHRKVIEGKRPDIDIVSSQINYDSFLLDEGNIENLLSHRPIYVISPQKGYCPGYLLRDYDFKAAGSIWQVVERKD